MWMGGQPSLGYDVRNRKLDTSNNSGCWADWTISAMFG
jgi:hypothetical protein